MYKWTLTISSSMTHSIPMRTRNESRRKVSVWALQNYKDGVGEGNMRIPDTSLIVQAKGCESALVKGERVRTVPAA